MTSDDLKEILMQSISLEEVYVKNMDKHYKIIVVSKSFININRVEQQKIVYAPLVDYIVKNIIHSVIINTYSPEEWRSIRSLNNDIFM